jgi:hypothetical protein
MRNKHTWTPEQAREMARKARETRRKKLFGSTYGLSQPQDSRVVFTRCEKPFPSPNFRIEINETLIITRNWFGTIVSSVMAGVILGIIIVALEKLI